MRGNDIGIRKNYRSLTDVERDRFIQALFHVKSTGFIDEFARIHAEHFFMGIHRSSQFLPWHREMLLRFERELQKFHSEITIPYWDSTVDRNPSDPLWNNNFLGQFNLEWGLGRALGSGPLSTLQEVESNQGRDNYDTFWRELENPIHNRPHVWVGGVMADVASPGDPAFYLHHCCIDMLWARWQLAPATSGAPFISSGSGLGLHDPLMEWPDRTPADVLDHHDLGYTYDTETQFKTGQLLSYGDAGTPGNVSDPVIVGFGGWLDFKFLFAGRNATGENRIYAVEQNGQLLSYGDAGTPGNVSNPVVVGFGGWLDFKFLFAGKNAIGENRIYAVDQNGQLLSYGDAGTPGNISDPVVVGFGGWLDFKFLFSGVNLSGEDRIYAVVA
ncbi:tyrosinase family protein [Nitrosomonas communis]|uniref:Common central domain of tyrosinase n=1 Tax=Nitrosomonas communis TaxID=44574 RepID=A0A1I4T9J4_9PROT|nr:tyrosinase family protein [Nitrosomonas communis]SFM73389.1 Common central domain of tyrosinase [Nitrosomonas communis]